MCKDANKCFHGLFQNPTTFPGELVAFLQLQVLDFSLLTCLSLAANPGMASIQFLTSLKAASMAQLLHTPGSRAGPFWGFRSHPGLRLCEGLLTLGCSGTRSVAPAGTALLPASTPPLSTIRSVCPATYKGCGRPEVGGRKIGLLRQSVHTVSIRSQPRATPRS